MAGLLPGDPSHHGIVETSPYRSSHDKHDEAKTYGASWYYSRKEIEENSPSRRDGIDLKKETYLRKSYCTFLQDLGMRLKVPQVTIATAIVFCHRFFLRQSHAKNDRRTIATVCMFLAGKVEETPRPLKDVILVSYEIINKKDPAAIQRIKQKEVYEQQKELILIGERLVLATLGFDLNVHHPYKPLVEAIKKFKVAQNALAQVAWNFVNDGLRTSLCLQFKPHHIAAGAIFLAAKFLKVKLPSDGEKVWWQEFDVTPRQLEEVSNQMLELYEQNRMGQPSHGNETEGSCASIVNQRPTKVSADNEDSGVQNSHSQASKTVTNVPSTASTTPVREQLQHGKQNGSHSTVQNDPHDYVRHEPRTGVSVNRAEAPVKDRKYHEPGNSVETSGSRPHHGLDQQGSTVAPADANAETREKNPVHSEGSKDYSPMMDAIKKIDKDKVKAALEKRRKSRGDVAKKLDLMDEDDLIERELEHGVELAVEDEKNKQERTHSWSKSTHRHEPTDRVTENGHHGTEKMMENAEEGELSLDCQEFHSPDQSSRKRKAASPGKHISGKDEYDPPHYHSSSSKHRDSYDDLRVMGRFDRVERDHKRQRQENQV